MKTSIDIDKELAREAQAVLGTSNLKSTVDAALREIVDIHKRVALIQFLGEADLDWDAAEQAWGGDH